MASNDAIEIHVLEENGEDIVRKWLVKLDDLIVPESLEIIKLSLWSELNQAQLESIRRVFDLYDVLKRKYDDEQKILSRIMYALMMLGHKRYGCYALKKLGRQHYDRFDPSCLPESPGTDHNKFCTCQRLATICIALPQENKERFIKHFAKQLKINHNTVKTPCEVLIKMLEFDKINFENHKDLIEEAVFKSHLSDDAIKKYKYRCEKILLFGQAPISLYQCNSQCSSVITLDSAAVTTDNEDSESTGRTSLITDDDNDDNVSESTTHTRLRKSRSSADLRNRPHHKQTNKSDPPTSIIKHHSALENCYRRHADVIKCMLNDVKLLLSHDCLKIHLLHTGNICGLGFLSFPAITLVMMGALLVYSSQLYADITTLYWSDTTAVVANSSRAFSLQVIQDSRYAGDYEHEIKLYRVKLKCSEQPTLTDKYTLENDTQLTFINETTVYAWTGSSIMFHICGSTNQSTNFQRHLDVVIVKGLNEQLQFAETILPTFYQGLHFSPGINGEWMCTNKTVDINDPDYYTVIFLPQSTADCRFNYSITYSIRSVDLTQLQVTAILHKDQAKWDVPEPSWFEYDFCVIATFNTEYDNSVRSQVHIRTRYRTTASIIDTIKPGQAMLLSGLLLFTFGIIIILIYDIAYCIHVCRKKNVSFTD